MHKETIKTAILYQLSKMGYNAKTINIQTDLMKDLNFTMWDVYTLGFKLCVAFNIVVKMPDELKTAKIDDMAYYFAESMDKQRCVNEKG